MIKTFLFIFFISYTQIISLYCPSSFKKERELKLNFEKKLEDSIVSGINYGTPIAIGNLLFLKGDFEVTPGVLNLQTTCPKGYRQPTEGEYASIMSILGSSYYETMTDKDGLNFDIKKYYLSSTKTYPELTSGASSEAWEFKCLYHTNRKFSIKSLRTHYGYSIVTKCVRDFKNYPVIVETPSKDVISGESYEVAIDTSTINVYIPGFNGYYFDFFMNDYPLKRKISDSEFYQGTYYFSIYGLDYFGNDFYFCKEIYIREKKGSDVESFITNKSEQDNRYSEIKPYIIDDIFKSPSTAPGFIDVLSIFNYLFLSKEDNHLHKINYELNNTNKDLGFGGIPVDMISTPDGYVLYAISNTVKGYSFIIGFDLTFHIKFNKTIINNGENPTEIKDQITFYKESSVPEFGMEAMHEPLGGKLAYGRGRIALLFSHFNNFGAGTSERDDRSGDTFITFDENGEDVKYAWSWGTSQSLIQTMIYDGQYFFTVSLGDNTPCGFRVCAVNVEETTTLFDPINKKYAQHKSYCTDDLAGYFRGKQARLGGLIQMGDKYALVYGYNAGKKKISMVTFKFENGEFIDVTTYPIIELEYPIVNLRASKYGNKIFIIYSLSDLEDNYYGLRSTVSPNDKSYYLLASITGDVMNGPYESKYNSIGGSENIIESTKGGLFWNYVNSDGLLHSIKIADPTPQEIVNEDGNETESSKKKADIEIETNGQSINSQVGEESSNQSVMLE